MKPTTAKKALLPEFIEADSSIRIRYRGKFLTAPDQLSSNQRRFKQLPADKPCLVLLASPLFCSGLRAFLAECAETFFFACIEYESALQDVLTDSRSELAGLNHERCCIVTNSIEDERRLIEWIRNRNINTVVLLSLSGGSALHWKRYQSLLQRCRQEVLRTQQNRLTKRFFIRRWTKNLFHNLLIPASWQSLPIKRPVFLLGAGPSAEEWLPVLHSARDTFFLLAVDSVLPALASMHITPDLVVSQDAQLLNCWDLLPNYWKKVHFLCDLTVHPTIPRQAAAAFFLSTFAPLRLIRKLQEYGMLTIPNLGSVGISAYYLLRKYYSGPLFFAGMDMHYLPGKSHVKNSASHRALLATMNRLSQGAHTLIHFTRPRIRAQDKYAQPCYADLVLSSYAELFASLLQHDTQVQDLGKWGLPLHAPFQRSVSKVLQYAQSLPDQSFHITVPSHNQNSVCDAIVTIEQEIKSLQTFLAMPAGKEKQKFLETELEYIAADSVSLSSASLDEQENLRRQMYDQTQYSARDYLSYLQRKILFFSRFQDGKKGSLR